MIIDKDGNVGIGTINPNKKLHVQGDVKATGSLIGNLQASDGTTIIDHSTKTFSGTLSGNAATVTNGVYTIGDQSIGGNKTFTDKVSIQNSTEFNLELKNTNYVNNYSGSTNVKVGSIKLFNADNNKYSEITSTVL